MERKKRVFILGAGFSKPAGMPLATELLPLLAQKLQLEPHDEMQKWLDGLRERLVWLRGSGQQPHSSALNIEEVFHCAHFDIEAYLLKQHLCDAGQRVGPGVARDYAELISGWLLHLEDALRDVIVEEEEKANFAPIIRWAESVNDLDTVLTFNYDTLVEQALSKLGKTWNHGMGREVRTGNAICKLHGSIDWIVADRIEHFKKLDLLFDQQNTNRASPKTGYIEDDYRLWRCRTRDQLQDWISGRDFQLVPEDASLRSVGIAGLGAYKQPHKIPGLGLVWHRGMRALYESDAGIFVGFSMSDFDTLARMQFAEVARKRQSESRPLRVVVIDPHADSQTKKRFEGVFRSVELVISPHQKVDWSIY